MKLYEVPRNSKIRMLEKGAHIPITSLQIKPYQILHFSRVDGMYSYCTTEDGKVVHPAAWTDVEIVK